MKAASFALFLFLLIPLTVGCGSGEPKTVTDGANADQLAEYEAELAKATGEDIETEDE